MTYEVTGDALVLTPNGEALAIAATKSSAQKFAAALNDEMNERILAERMAGFSSEAVEIARNEAKDARQRAAELDEEVNLWRSCNERASWLREEVRRLRRALETIRDFGYPVCPFQTDAQKDLQAIYAITLEAVGPWHASESHNGIAEGRRQ